MSEGASYQHLPIRSLSGEELLALSKRMKLSLTEEDMLAVQSIYREWDREPTDVELEVIAQTWSEHCKHRIFGARIEHVKDGMAETVDGLFRTFVRQVSEEIMEGKPGFVLSAFHDNAGFITLDENLAVCLKAETHNHPSAIEPYAGANTGLGGVIRDILGAGLGAKPIGSLDVFCFGFPDTDPGAIKGEDVIHPRGILRGVVRGVRDYGNRMGIPTVAGAIQFDPAYLYNPLVYCGTAGVIPRWAIGKKVEAGHLVIAVGGRTGRDGLKGATFSSAALDDTSHVEDQQAVQIGNPIEEKKVADFILAARDARLIEFVTDCGAGGFSSAAGEMLSECGGIIRLESAPLKEQGLVSWEIFISESQERMVLAVKAESLPGLQRLAAMYETELCVLGEADGSGVLKVSHHGTEVCRLDNRALHEAPRQHRRSTWTTPSPDPQPDLSALDVPGTLKALLSDFAVCSREPVIREYDHEVQGNTVLKPLAGGCGDAPQDGAVLRIDGSDQLLAIGLSILPEWGKTDPEGMGLAVVDECFRQLVCTGANPDRIALLDNFCMGNPNDARELGALVETCRGMAEAAKAYASPFVSGKDSFYNYFEVDGQSISIPVTLLLSGMGIVERVEHVTGTTVRRPDSALVWIGQSSRDLGGSVLARRLGLGNLRVPRPDLARNLALYRILHQAIRDGLVLAAHDVSEGGLAVALAEMSFGEKADLLVDGDLDAFDLFNEAPGQVVLEVPLAAREEVCARFAGLPARAIGVTRPGAGRLLIAGRIDESVSVLKAIWKAPLAAHY
jgi:phosphoribosylformylglycinamidine synthase